MNYKEELSAMQAKFTKHPPGDLHLAYPIWLKPNDPMAAVFREADALCRHGQVVYGRIVQANTFLFTREPDLDCPAHFLYSTDPYAAENPEILREVAMQLYRYKDQPLHTVPDRWREIARVITDEHDRSDFTFTLEYGGRPMEFRFLPALVFRKFLPRHRLCSNLLPIITAPGCSCIVTLPKGYWSGRFKILWAQGKL